MLEKYPKAISLSWIKSRRSIKKVSFEQCERLLKKINSNIEQDLAVATQLQLLYQLTETEKTRLRQVQTVTTPSIKGKVYWQNNTTSELGFLSMPAVILCSNQQTALPEYTKLSTTPPTTKRRKRKDAKLPEIPLLPSIRVYLAKK